MPRAVFWYAMFCCLQIVLNAVMFAISAWFIARHDQLANEFVSPTLVLGAGLFCAPASLFVGGLNVWLLLLPRSPKAWSMHFSNLAVGAATCVLTPIAVPLLVLWSRPEVRGWYGKPR